MRAVEAGDIGQIHMVPMFMGLLGTTGALPLHYTEVISERETYQRDRTARAFLDIFSNRAVALHYAAWKKYRLAYQYELYHEERFVPLLLYLAGMGLPGLKGRMLDGQGDVFDQAVAYYSGTIRQRPVSASLLQHMLSDYFSMPLRVEQFVGTWYRVPKKQMTRIGLANAQLGVSALAGDRIWQRDLRMRLLIGPLDREEFNAFLPGGDAENALKKWLTLMTGSCLEYEIRLVLKAENVRPASIGGSGSARLGWDSFLCSQPATEPRSDTCYTLHTMH
jgi:type VI secretion system protein ImpH